MAKQKKRTTTMLPTSEDFESALGLLRGRANALIIELAKRYQLAKAEELTAVLDAMDSVADIQRSTRVAAP